MSNDATLHIVLHQPDIPQNTGNIARTCVAIGAKLWLVRPLGFQVDEKSLRRAGIDCWKYLHWEVVDDWRQLDGRLAERPLWFFSKRGQTSYTDVEYKTGDALIFGSETAGLPESIHEQYHERMLRIPIRPEVRCLNLSNSMAIAAYEAVRQMGVSLDSRS